MPLDEISPSFVLEPYLHNRKTYPYIYYCPNCVRSYLARTKEEACKFCAGTVTLVTGGKRYIYFCENCDTRVESDEPKMACTTCGRRLLTLYRWDMLNKQEKRRIKFAKMLRNFSTIRKAKVKDMKGKSDPVVLTKGPKAPKKVKKTRGKEELPTSA